MQIGIDSFAAAHYDNGEGQATTSVEEMGQLLDRIEHAVR